jgi:DNA adenine methylase
VSKVASTASGSSKCNIRRNLKEFERRFDKVVIECKTWEDLLPIYDGPKTFFFFDPPYINSEKNIGYQPFDEAQMEKLREAIDSLEAQWLVTVCDSPECRRVFKGYKFTEISRTNGIENRRGHSTQYKELIITKS